VLDHNDHAERQLTGAKVQDNHFFGVHVMHKALGAIFEHNQSVDAHWVEAFNAHYKVVDANNLADRLASLN
jgi:hypothetical protein